jgi:hypothetical protein
VTTDGPPRTPLPAKRAFVVQLRADADPGTGAISGRVEHVSSGSAALFDSVAELIAWMHAVIAGGASIGSSPGTEVRRDK